MDILVKNKILSGSIGASPSKSYGQRALFLALMAKGGASIKMHGPLAQDLEKALGLVRALAQVDIEADTYHIRPRLKDGVQVNVGESATGLRLIIPILGAMGLGARIKREGSLVSRTLAPYMEVLPKMGMTIKEEGHDLVIGGQLRPGTYPIPGDVSSQFISGLLMGLSYLAQESRIDLTSDLGSKAYVSMTIEVMKAFGLPVKKEESSYIVGGGNSVKKEVFYEVEGDYSSALFFLGLGVGVRGLKKNSIQADRLALDYMKSSLGYVDRSKVDVLRLVQERSPQDLRVIDADPMPDSVPILSVLSAAVPGTTRVINIKRLRLKESDRVESTLALLRSLGLKPKLEKDSFSFSYQGPFKPSRINSFNDHRIAMAGAVASHFASGDILIENALVNAKSYPDFWDDLKSLGGEFYVQ